jgi:hypothetical protein
VRRMKRDPPRTTMPPGAPVSQRFEFRGLVTCLGPDGDARRGVGRAASETGHGLHELEVEAATLLELPMDAVGALAAKPSYQSRPTWLRWRRR